MSNGRRRVPARLYRYRGSTSRAYKRRRFIRPGRRLPTYNRTTRYTSRPLGNPLAITERKYWDVERATAQVYFPTPNWSACSMDPITSPDTIPSKYSFNAISVGTSWQQRIGRKVQILSLKLKGQIWTNPGYGTATDPLGSQTIRVLFYIDKQANGEYPSTPQTLIYSGPSSANQIDMFQDGNSFGRYKILRDYRFNLDPKACYYNYQNNTRGVAQITKIIDYTHVFNPPLTVHYNGANTVTNQDIIDNSIHMAVAKSADATPTVYCSYKARLAFLDC